MFLHPHQFHFLLHYLLISLIFYCINFINRSIILFFLSSPFNTFTLTIATTTIKTNTNNPIKIFIHLIAPLLVLFKC